MVLQGLTKMLMLIKLLLPFFVIQFCWPTAVPLPQVSVSLTCQPAHAFFSANAFLYIFICFIL